MGKDYKQIWHMAEIVNVSMRLDEADMARRFGAWVKCLLQACSVLGFD
jgi:hypothetical protein